MKEYRKQAKILRAMSHPVRLQILEILARGPECVCNLTESLHKRQPYISQHLMVLRDADLVTAERQEKNNFYRLNISNLSIIRQAVRDMCQNHNQTIVKETHAFPDPETEK